MNNVEWLNNNTTRAYPLMEDEARISNSGVKLPNSILTDAAIVIPSLNGQLPYIQSINVSTSNVSGTLFIGTTQIASFAGEVTGPYSRLTVTGIDEYAAARGVVVTGDPAVYLGEFTGVATFAEGQTTLVPRGSYEAPGGVDGISAIDNGRTVINIQSGVVRLVAGSRVTLTEVPAVTTETVDPITGQSVLSEVTPPGIRIDVTQGEFSEECDCGDGGGSLPEPIRSINGVTGDANGNINITSTTECVQIGASTNQVTITDTCSTPCCGCEELDAINAQLDAYRSTVETLEQRASELATVGSDFRNNVLASL